jgi:hypothetical protein
MATRATITTTDDRTVIDVKSQNNETFAFSHPVSLANESWPIDDVTFHAQIRDPNSNELVLDFSTAADGLSINNVSSTAKTLTLAYAATPAQVAGLLGVYPGDLKLIRGARENVIADITATFEQGYTE